MSARVATACKCGSGWVDIGPDGKRCATGHFVSRSDLANAANGTAATTPTPSNGTVVATSGTEGRSDSADGSEAELALPDGKLPSDAGNGERIAADHGADLRYVAAWKGWLAWDGRRWQRDDTGRVSALAQRTMRARVEDFASLLADASKDERPKLLRAVKFALGSESEPRLRAALVLAQPRLAARPGDFDRDPWLLNVENGTIDLRTGRLRPHRRTDSITRLAPVTFDAAAQCPRWLDFLGRVMGGDEALIAFLRRLVGYIMTGTTDEQVIVLFFGGGANGKSTFVEIVRTLLGTYAQTSPFSTFLAAERDHGPRNDLARMAGSRLVVAVETREGRRLDETLVKTLTGGDTVTARYLYGEHFEFRPTFKLVLVANSRPVITGTDHAIWRRVRLVPWTVTISDGERDPRLGEKLRAELPGILNWALRGCLEWQSDGLGAAETVAAATAAYRAESDEAGRFLDEACAFDAQTWTPSAALRDAFAAWSGRKASDRSLTDALTRRGCVPKSGRHAGRVVRG